MINDQWEQLRGERMQIEIYVQARMRSKRLPGKVLREVLGKPLLDFQIERLRQAKEANEVVILTSTHPADDAIVEFCKQKEVLCYRGPEDDVLARYQQVAIERQPDAIVRITSDCPLIDPEITDMVIKTYRNAYPTFDYVSNTLKHTFPRGLDTEIFSLQALDNAFKNGQLSEEREHVTPYLYRHPELFNLANVASDINLSKYRWTVDTIEDFTLIKLILEHLYPNQPDFRLYDVINLLKQHPDWMSINSQVKQKLL